MPLRRPSVLPSVPPWACHLLVAVLILGAAGLHLAYLALDCRLDLAPDEAHYWDWSRHLDWSYYSKGPLVAWLIRASCELVGPWAERHTGSLVFAIRFPAVVCGTLLLLSVYVLTLQVYRRPMLGLGVVAFALTLPVIAAGSSLMTIDSPYTCCWGWALVLGYQAVFRGSWWAWLGAGVLVGLGILAKYTMVLWLPSLALFLLTTPPLRRELVRPGFWSLVVVVGLCCLPILIWNSQHGWVTVLHVGHLAGVVRGVAETTRSDPRIYWLGPLAYVGGQCLLLLVYWFVGWVAAMVAHRPGREREPALRYLWWMSAPMFLLFLGFSIKTGGGELNWPVTAYLSGLVLTAGWLAEQLSSEVRWYSWLSRVSLALACGAGLFLTFFMHRSDLLYPVLERLTGPPTRENPYPIRKLDPSCRLRGWRALGAEVDRLREDLEQEGERVVLAGCAWSLPGELGVYCAGHPPAYSLGLLHGDRHSQYDFWDGPLTAPESFRGATFIVVGGLSAEGRAGFEYVDPACTFHYHENGRPIASFTINVCHGFKGFPKVSNAGNH